MIRMVSVDPLDLSRFIEPFVRKDVNFFVNIQSRGARNTYTAPFIFCGESNL
jgi:hypothetical protein